MTRGETDPALRRIERNAWIACAVMTVGSLAVSGGRLDVAAGVLGGGALVAVSYRAIKGGVGALASALAAGAAGAPDAGPTGAQRRTMARAAAAFIGRYALLALLAYVMIARLRLHPIGLIAGASSVVIAVAAEAVRLVARAGRS